MASRRRLLLRLAAVAAAVAVAAGQGVAADEAPNPEFVVRRNAARELHGINAVRTGSDTGLEVQLAGEGEVRASGASEAAGEAVNLAADAEPTPAAAAAEAPAKAPVALNLLQDAAAEELPAGPRLTAAFRIADRAADFDRIKFWGKLADYLQVRRAVRPRPPSPRGESDRRAGGSSHPPPSR